MKTQKNSWVKRGIVLFITFIMAFTTFALVGCGGRDDGTGNKNLDESKSQLRIGVYDGGLGYAWVREVADSFEEFYADKSFETGKTGVQVLIDPQNDNFLAGNLRPNLQLGVGTMNDVYYTPSGYWDYTDSGVVLDVSSTLSENVYDANGELAARTGNPAVGSILDKMDPFFVENYKHTDGKYYGWPFEDSLQGIVYDVDLFEKKGYEVPETMEDFANLLEDMRADGVVPFIFNGNAPTYYTCLTTAAVVQYEGVEAANMNVTYSGTYGGNSNVGAGKAVAGNSTFKGSYEPKTITYENANLLADQQGKYEAIKFLKLLVSKEDYYGSNSFKAAETHLKTQQDFVYSAQINEAGRGDRFAMIIDGDWWENEARLHFDNMGSGANANKYGYGVRNFSMMPFPKMTGQAMDKRVLVASSNGKIAFINKNTQVAEIAKLWLQFQHQDSALSTFTANTGSVLPYDYDLRAEDRARMSKFAQNVWDLRHSEDVYIYHEPYKMHTFYLNSEDSDAMGLSGIRNDIKILKDKNGWDGSSNLLLKFFWQNKNATAEQVFQASLDFYANDRWEKALESFKDTYPEYA